MTLLVVLMITLLAGIVIHTYAMHFENIDPVYTMTDKVTHSGTTGDGHFMAVTSVNGATRKSAIGRAPAK